MKQNLEATNSIQEITPTMSNQLIDQDNPILITNASHNFYKTKICPYFLMGKCTKGSRCSFAHSKDEIREQPNLKKTKLCKDFQTGKCTNASCPFAHGESELKATPDFYKTSICTPFLEGKCQYGDKCRYAHGKDELRPTGKSKKKIKKSITALPPPLAEERKSDFKHSVSSVASMVDKEISCAALPDFNKKMPIEPINDIKEKMQNIHIIAPIKKLNTLESILKQEQLNNELKPRAPFQNAKSLLEAPPGFYPKVEQYSHFLPFMNYGSNTYGNQPFQKQASNTDTMDSWGMEPPYASFHPTNHPKNDDKKN